MHVAGLWRHPVKSLQGVAVPRATVSPGGVVGDRAWGVRDVATGSVLSAKREPRLLQAAAQVEGEGVRVTVAGVGVAVGRDADRLLSEWLGREVRLDLAIATAYVDLAPLHVVAADELGRWDPRRFRPNVVVDAVASLDALVGERLRVGSCEVELTKRTKRCAMPTMAQPGVKKDVDVLRTLARTHDLRLGVYADVITPGTVAVGDAVTVV